MNVVYEFRGDLEDEIVKALEVAKIIDSMEGTKVLSHSTRGYDIILRVQTHPTYFYDIIATLRQYMDGGRITYEDITSEV